MNGGTIGPRYPAAGTVDLLRRWHSRFIAPPAQSTYPAAGTNDWASAHVHTVGAGMDPAIGALAPKTLPWLSIACE
jgi:hypothetical protein